jgi:hypothetical protein
MEGRRPAAPSRPGVVTGGRRFTPARPPRSAPTFAGSRSPRRASAQSDGSREGSDRPLELRARLGVLRGDVQRLGAHTARRSAADFEVLAFAPTMLSDDTEAAADGFRPYLALYIGGMGAKEMNFHFDVFARMGYEEAAKRFRAHVRA